MPVASDVGLESAMVQLWLGARTRRHCVCGALCGAWSQNAADGMACVSFGLGFGRSGKAALPGCAPGRWHHPLIALILRVTDAHTARTAYGPQHPPNTWVHSLLSNLPPVWGQCLHPETKVSPAERNGSLSVHIEQATGPGTLRARDSTSPLIHERSHLGVPLPSRDRRTCRTCM
jgi:hypothetical protein